MRLVAEGLQLVTGYELVIERLVGICGNWRSAGVQRSVGIWILAGMQRFVGCGSLQGFVVYLVGTRLRSVTRCQLVIEKSAGIYGTSCGGRNSLSDRVSACY